MTGQKTTKPKGGMLMDDLGKVIQIIFETLKALFASPAESKEDDTYEIPSSVYGLIKSPTKSEKDNIKEQDYELERMLWEIVKYYEERDKR